MWPRPKLSIAVALFAALLLGSGAALASELISPRVNRAEELLLEQRLPILARIPRMPRRAIARYLTGRERLPGTAWEAYRTLRASLATAGRNGGFPRTILVWSSIPGEGKTLTSVNLAITMALSGVRVVLVDADLRRPMIATAFESAGTLSRLRDAARCRRGSAARARFGAPPAARAEAVAREPAARLDGRPSNT